MRVIDTSISDVKIIEPEVFGDDRGFFMETWNQKEFEINVTGKATSFVQDNHSYSVQNTLRGLHYQIKQPQGKLVRVIHGEVFDVAVDLRKESSTFGQWVGEYLSAANKRLFWVPPGFAHGFFVTSKKAEFVYKCTDYYAPEYECSIKWNDPALNIEWPLFVGSSPIVSQKDNRGLLFSDAKVF